MAFLLIPAHDHVAMQFLGNAIAVPHAVWALAHGVQCFPVNKSVDPVEALHQAHHLRVRSDTCALLRVQHGWLLTSLQSLSRALAHQSLRLQVERGLAPLQVEFYRVDVTLGNPEHETLEIFFSEHLQPQEALQAFGLRWDGALFACASKVLLQGLVCIP